MPSSAKNWCFTVNNYVEDHEQLLSNASENDEVLYLVYGREQGESGTPHLQGYVSFTKRKTMASIKALFGISHVHLEVSRGTPRQASDYCKKDGDYEEYGQCPTGQGKRTDVDEYIDYIKTVDPLPNEEEIAARFPKLWLKYRSRLIELLHIMRPIDNLVAGDERPRDGWQRELFDRLHELPNERSINFVVDTEGNSGKTWMTRYFMTHFPDKTQVLRIGKRDDLALAIDPVKSIFLFDVPRGQMEFLQYSVLEMIKDRIIFSPKFHSTTKILRSLAHVVVFSNEAPEMDKLTSDRYIITNIS